MGTRGLYGFRKNNKDKTTYNHYDSYPEGLGADVISFIQKHSIKDMNDLYDRIIMVNEHSAPTEEQKANCMKNSAIDLSVSSQSTNDWYCLLRNLQGNLDALCKCDVPYMIDNEDFIKDSLFCEYAYIINLDDNVLEFYKGFQKRPQLGNRYGTNADRGYYPCKLVAEIPIAYIYSNDHIIETFMKNN